MTYFPNKKKNKSKDRKNEIDGTFRLPEKVKCRASWMILPDFARPDTTVSQTTDTTSKHVTDTNTATPYAKTDATFYPTTGENITTVLLGLLVPMLLAHILNLHLRLQLLQLF